MDDRTAYDPGRKDITVLYHQGRPIDISTPESRFLDRWSELKDAIIPEKTVRTLTRAQFVHYQRYGRWCYDLSKGMPCPFQIFLSDPNQKYVFEGLQALSILFEKETHDAIRFKPLQAFPEIVQYPEHLFKGEKMACAYDQWQQGFLISLMRFGEVEKDVAGLLSAYSDHPEFLSRYQKELKRGPRPMLTSLRGFALEWDTFFVPLRYFTASAALGFARERLKYKGTDERRFREVFLYGGNRNQGRGLKLKSSKKSIVRSWNETFVEMSLESAMHHGFKAQELRAALSEIVRPRVLKIG
jgi:hypothetical protein